MRRRSLVGSGLPVFAALWVCGTNASAQTGVRKGPWLMDPSVGSITVLIERESPGPVSVRAVEIASGSVGLVGSTVEARDDAATTMHEVTLRGLRPGVRYRYEVRGPSMQTAEGSFLSAPDRPGPLRFVLYGDTRSDHAAHTAVAQAIAREAPDFVVHTGDLVAEGRAESLWQEFFAIEHDLLRNTVFLPVIGNHELMDEQGLGAANYRRYVHCAPDGPSPEMDYAITFGSIRLVLTNAFDDWTQPQPRAWLDQTLARARRESPDGFLFVVTHWGQFSSGYHGENDLFREIGFDQILRRNRVDLLVSGHDHSYERGDANGLRFIVSGGSGAPLYPRTRRNDYTRFFASAHHYVLGELDGDTIQFTTKRPDGSLLERCALKHSGWDCGPVGAPAPTPAAPVREPAVPRTNGACACHAAPAPDAHPCLPALALGALVSARRRRKSASQR